MSPTNTTKPAKRTAGRASDHKNGRGKAKSDDLFDVRTDLRSAAEELSQVRRLLPILEELAGLYIEDGQECAPIPADLASIHAITRAARIRVEGAARFIDGAVDSLTPPAKKG